MKPSIPENVLALEPYKPGKPIEEVERELGIRDSIKVASNENPLGPSPAALAALLKAAADIHRYPDGGAVRLTERLAAKLSVEPSQIVFGDGSNELIELLARLFASGGGEVVMSSDAFLIYRLVTLAIGATPVAVPARDHCHDLAAMAAAVGPRTRLVFLANPNNPTGTIYREPEWRAFVDAVPEHVVIVVDEAYGEYVDDRAYPRTLDDVRERANLVMLRTFSKIYGLAGLRIGYGVGPHAIMGAAARLRQPFNVGSLAQAAALAALDDEAHVEASRRLVRAGRERYARACDALGLAYLPSQANFVLIGVGDGDRITRLLLERGVIVRPMAAYGMPDKIRVTFGTEAEDERCIAALRAILAEAAA
jgi:histidinol-phosphate aminotransferase